MRSAFRSVDAVYIGKDALCVRIVILEGDLHITIFLLAIKIYRLLVEDPLVAVNILHEGYDPALVQEFALLAVSFIRQDYFESLVQEGHFAETVGKDIETELNFLEYLVIGLEGDLCSPAPRLPHDFQLARGLAPRVRLPVNLPFPSYFQLEV